MNPDDPHGLRHLEQAAWQHFYASPAFQMIFERLSVAVVRDRELSNRDKRIAGDEADRSIFSLSTLGYVFDNAAEAGCTGMEAALSAYNDWHKAHLDVMVYMTGRCHEFALAFHEATGKPMAAVMVPDLFGRYPGERCPIHLLCVVSEQEVVDATGLRRLEDVVQWYGQEQVTVQEVTRADILAFIAQQKLSPLQDMEAAARMADIVISSMEDILQAGPSSSKPAAFS